MLKKIKQRRRKMVRKRIPLKNIKAFIAAFLTGLIIFGIHLVLKPAVKRLQHLPVFNVRHITVKNNRYFEPEDLVESSGIVMGKSVFDQDIKAAVAKIKKSFVLKNIIVFRKLPDEVVIEVTERFPVALVNHGDVVGVDDEGVLLPHIKGEKEARLPRIMGIEGLSQRSFLEHLRKSVNLIVEIGKRKPELLGTISEIRVNDINRLGICLGGGGCEILFGLNNWSEKIELLPLVLKEFKGRLNTFRYLDMRFNKRVFVRKK